MVTETVTLWNLIIQIAFMRTYNFDMSNVFVIQEIVDILPGFVTNVELNEDR